MDVPPPSQVVPSYVRWVVGGAWQANLDLVTWRSRTPAAVKRIIEGKGECVIARPDPTAPCQNPPEILGLQHPKIMQ
jgi:hypothetical protein